MTFVLLPFILAWRIEEDPSEEELADRKSEEAVTSRCRVFHFESRLPLFFFLSVYCFIFSSKLDWPRNLEFILVAWNNQTTRPGLSRQYKSYNQWIRLSARFARVTSTPFLLTNFSIGPQKFTITLVFPPIPSNRGELKG